MMSISSRMRHPVQSWARTIATKTKLKLVGDLDESLVPESAQQGFTGKIHPGRIHNPVSELPLPLQKAMDRVLADQQISSLLEKGAKFSKQLLSRCEPSKATNKRKWAQVNYTEQTSYVYLLARMAPEYAVMNRVFGELSKWVPNFAPKTIFDFGSGVGSVSWAAISLWGKKLSELYCVDSSAAMNNMAELLMKGGDRGGHFYIPETYFRQFSPATANRKFDLVVSAHTLFEFPSLEARLETYHNLWAKTSNYFVLVEQGTTEGFKLIDEAKEFILFSAKKDGTPAHILAPCPHVEPCPRLLREGDRTPCNFETRFYPFSRGRERQAEKERFSFVIIGKGPRPSSLPQWPRLVREPLVRNKHTICRMCTPDGKLEEVTFTRSKDGPGAYLCARSSQWGDFLPVTISSKEFTIRDKGEKKNPESNQDEVTEDNKILF